jgi:hypothetical protein
MFAFCSGCQGQPKVQGWKSDLQPSTFDLFNFFNFFNYPWPCLAGGHEGRPYICVLPFALFNLFDFLNFFNCPFHFPIHFAGEHPTQT